MRNLVVIVSVCLAILNCGCENASLHRQMGGAMLDKHTSSRVTPVADGFRVTVVVTGWDWASCADPVVQRAAVVLRSELEWISRSRPIKPLPDDMIAVAVEENGFTGAISCIAAAEAIFADSSAMPALPPGLDSLGDYRRAAPLRAIHRQLTGQSLMMMQQQQQINQMQYQQDMQRQQQIFQPRR